MGAISRPPLSSASHLNAKRYLILVYSVEFDRIHYPLPLPYAGKLDPAALHRLVCDLREELAQLRAQRKDSHRDTEIRRLQDELQRALEEKQAQAAALRHAEEKLTREKARHWREHRKLTAELAEVTASEQRLQLQVKSLMAELASYKRGRRTPAGAGPHAQERRSLSNTRLPPSRSASRESRSCSQGRPQPRSPSPAGPRPPRFDPTAFVRARQRRQKEAERKNQRSRAAFGSTSLARSSSGEWGTRGVGGGHPGWVWKVWRVKGRPHRAPSKPPFRGSPLSKDPSEDPLTGSPPKPPSEHPQSKDPSQPPSEHPALSRTPSRIPPHRAPSEDRPS
ncbi:centrosomal protein CCDC61-like [Phalacrocorax carbo]|uniref:centrosomal protein CCDC61-like n=1 Tax=Phalacrocorax carbo TaxID=9209 RepID=UPI00311A6CE3